MVEVFCFEMNSSGISICIEDLLEKRRKYFGVDARKWNKK
jgi:hypothetical protein